MKAKYLKVREAAKYLGIHIDTLKKWEKEGVLTPIRIGNRRDRFYTKEMLEEAFSAKTNN